MKFQAQLEFTSMGRLVAGHGSEPRSQESRTLSLPKPGELFQESSRTPALPTTSAAVQGIALCTLLCCHCCGRDFFVSHSSSEGSSLIRHAALIQGILSLGSPKKPERGIGHIRFSVTDTPLENCVMSFIKCGT